MWHVTVKNPGPSPDRFRTLWFDDNLNTKIRKDSNASFERPMQGADGEVPAHANGLHDLYNSNDDPATADTNEDEGNIEAIWQMVIDEDGDPVYGDFGKVDLYSRTTAGADG